MYDFEKTELTLEEILRITTEYDIYSYYIGDQFKVGKIMHSPLREDNHPSFGVFKSSVSSNLMWKDQATGKTGNVIQFISEKFQESHGDSLRRLSSDVDSARIRISKMGKEIQERYKKTSTIISVQKKNFTEVDDAYWEQYFITRDILKKYNVFPILTFWVNDIPSNLFYSKTQPLYAYQVFDKFQIYSPYAQRKNKFRNSTTTYDIHGLEQLPKYGRLLIITKSKKDVMVLNRLGYDAIAPCGEQTPIPRPIIDDLRQRYNKVTVLYDNDTTGLKGALKCATEHGIEWTHLPLEYYAKFKIKDISDFIKYFKITKTREVLKEILTNCEKGKAT
jgi:hypothetical protein